MKKKSFTILEMIIVLTIIGIVLLMTKSLFSSRNRIYYQGETCINGMFYKVKDIKEAAMFGRRLSTPSIYGTSALAGGGPTLQFSTGILIEYPSIYRAIFHVPFSGFAGGRNFYVPGAVLSGAYRNAMLYNGASFTDSVFASGAGAGGYTLGHIMSYVSFSRSSGDSLDTTEAGDLGPGPNIYQNYYFPIAGIKVNGTTGYYPTGWFSSMPNCGSPDYFILSRFDTTNTGYLTMEVGMKNAPSTNERQMTLKAYDSASTATNLITGGVIYAACDYRATNCRDLFRLFVDTRVNDIFLQRCNILGSTGQICSQWQGGNIN